MLTVENIIIKEIKLKPRIDFKTNGYVTVEGRSLSEDPVDFYLPPLYWCKKLNSKEVNLDFKVDFMNAASVRYVSILL